MKIGIYGGSFDPVHYGHVNVAKTAVADLGLDRLVVVPAAVSPFKTDAGPGAGPWQRIEMVRAAFADVPNAVVDMREIKRGGVSYAIDTVREIAAENPGAKLYFIVGKNKIADDLDGAIWRARNIAAPLNAKRFNVKTPCVAHGGGKCFDCKSPERICKALMVFWERPNGIPDTEVVLINEDLGY